MAAEQTSNHIQTYRIYYKDARWHLQIERDGTWTVVGDWDTQDEAWMALRQERLQRPCPA